MLLFIACSEEKTINYDAQNETEIKNYLSKNKLDAKKTASGLYYVVKTEGTGKRPSSSANVTCYYKGYFTNGVVFDKSDSDGIDFNLSRLISGFSEGITLLKEGSEATLLIPSRLGYGTSGSRGVAPGSVLIFDVKLIKIK